MLKKCDVCEAEASVFLTQIINGQMTTVNLCENCSKEKGVTNEAGFGLAEAFVSQSTRAADPVADIACPACGFTAGQFRKIGRMGCPECYIAFQDGLDSMLRGMHKGIHHLGKRPSSIPALPTPSKPRRSSVPITAPKPQPEPIISTATSVELPVAPALLPEPPPAPESDLKKLRAELDLAVKEERYEDAGVIKLKIDELVKSGAK